MTRNLARSFILPLLMACGPLLGAASGPACGMLCGEWHLDAAASESRAQVLDAAFAKFKDPRPRHRPPPPPADADVATVGAVMDEESLRPTFNRPQRDELRDELQQLMRQPGVLTLSSSGKDIRVASNTGPGDRLTPGEPHTRVDRYGTAKISSNWKGPRLVVVEKYDRKNVQETTFSLRSSDGALEVVQVITRSGLPKVSFRSVYRTAAPPGLESGS